MASVRGSSMKMKSINQILATCVAGVFLCSVANAAQVLTPRVANTNTLLSTVPAHPAGTYLTFDVEYSVTTPQDGTESGIGVKVRYDSAFFETMPAAVSLNGIPADISNLYTKCMIAQPSPQTPLSGTMREVVFGWLDTTIRRDGSSPNGAVGWPNSADPSGTDGCLDPGSIANDGGALSPQLAQGGSGKRLFTIRLKSLSTSDATKSTTVTITSDGNVSYAKTTGVTEASTGSLAQTVKTIAVNGAPAPNISIASANPYMSRKTHGAAGTFDLPIDVAGTEEVGITNAITVEPRQAVDGQHQIVVAFATGTASAALYPPANVTAQVTGGASLPVSTTFGTNAVTTLSEMVITIGSAGTPVPNGARVKVVATGTGTASGVNPSFAIGFLLGDVTNNRGVTSGDTTAVRAVSGQTTNATNFRSDLNLTGGITSGDTTVVRSASGTSLP